MTLLAGIVIAVLAGLLAPTTRGLVGSVVVSMSAATAVQTWYLGSGRGTDPASTIHQISYWFVQVLIVAAITAVAWGIFRLRCRRAGGRVIAAEHQDGGSENDHDRVTMAAVTAPMSRAGLGTRGQR